MQKIQQFTGSVLHLCPFMTAGVIFYSQVQAGAKSKCLNFFSRFLLSTLSLQKVNSAIHVVPVTHCHDEPWSDDLPLFLCDNNPVIFCLPPTAWTYTPLLPNNHCQRLHPSHLKNNSNYYSFSFNYYNSSFSSDYNIVLHLLHFSSKWLFPFVRECLMWSKTVFYIIETVFLY